MVKLPNGMWAYVVFELIEINGKIVAKAVGGKIIEQKSEISKEEVLALPICCETENIKPIISPFFVEIKNIVKDLSFIVSQPARAPSIL